MINTIKCNLVILLSVLVGGEFFHSVSAEVLVSTVHVDECDEYGALLFDQNRVSKPRSEPDYDPYVIIEKCQNSLVEDPENLRFLMQLGVAMLVTLDMRGIEHIKVSAEGGYPAARSFLEKLDDRKQKGNLHKSERSEDIDACDRIGAVGFDVFRAYEPVPLDDYDAFKVKQVCSASLKKYPSNARFHFQLGWALLGLNEEDVALEHLRYAASSGYVAAKVVITKLFDY